MTRGVAYVSGPMAGKEDLNIRAFRLAEAWLERQNFSVMVPHDVPVWLHEGECPGGYRSSPDAPHAGACYLRTDIIAMLSGADVVFMLPGWELSIGARLEMQVAATCGLAVKFVPQEALDWMASPEPKIVFCRGGGSPELFPDQSEDYQEVLRRAESGEPTSLLPASTCRHMPWHVDERQCNNYEHGPVVLGKDTESYCALHLLKSHTTKEDCESYERRAK